MSKFAKDSSFDIDDYIEDVKKQHAACDNPGEALVSGVSGCGKAISPHAEDHLRISPAERDERRKEAVSKAVGRRILDLCEQYGYTVNTLAELSRMTQSTLSDIVTGKSKNIGIVTIKKICEGFYITLSDFFSGSLFDDLTTY